MALRAGGWAELPRRREDAVSMRVRKRVGGIMIRRSKVEQAIDVLEYLLNRTECSDKLAITRLVYAVGLNNAEGKSLVKHLQEEGLISFEKHGNFIFVSKTSRTYPTVQRYREAVDGLGL